MHASEVAQDPGPLWQRIKSHPIEDLGGPDAFVARLGREQRWSRAYAERAVEEYRRFAYLSISADAPLTPSDAVDQVWHLHLLHTRDYWGDFRAEVLGRDWHHRPAEDRADEGLRHVEQYAQTLHAYEQAFGEMPPRSHWPQWRDSLRSSVRSARVRVDRYWLIPRPRLRPVLGGIAMFLLPPTAHAIDLNPIDWTGPLFLVAYLLAFLIVLVFDSRARRTLPGEPESGSTANIGPIDCALLNGGRVRAAEALIVGLLVEGHLRMDGERIRPAEDWRPEDRMQASVRALSLQGSGISELVERVAAGMAPREQALVERGLLARPEHESRVRMRGVTVLLALLALGLVKIAVGLWRDRPVAFLVVLVIAVAIAAIFKWRRPIRLTRQGSQAFEALRARHSRLARGPRRHEYMLALALFGPGVLAATELAAFAQARAPNGGGDGGGSGGGSDGDSGSGGCGGCGGD